MATIFTLVAPVQHGGCSYLLKPALDTRKEEILERLLPLASYIFSPKEKYRVKKAKRAHLVLVRLVLRKAGSSMKNSCYRADGGGVFLRYLVDGACAEGP